MDLGITKKVAPLINAVRDMVNNEIEPLDAEFHSEIGKHPSGDRFQHTDRQMKILDELKIKARERGLWNFWLTDSEKGYGLTTVEYAYLAEEMGKVSIAAEVFNCNAPDTGNMEVLERVGTEAQKEQWLEPLLNGKIRSAYCMTEPRVMSSDAKQIETEAVLDGDEWVINGEKFYISGAGDPRCKIMITMVRTNPDADTYKQQSRILVPLDADGVNIVGPMHVFGNDDAPHGHMHIKLEDVRVPKENVLLGEGRGFEISQLRLGPGSIHHCMRSTGAAEKAIEMMVDRGTSREAFGKKLVNLGKNMEVISRSRIEVEAMRLMVLRAAQAMDTLGNAEARVWVSAVKAMVPEKCCDIINEAIQMHGAAGVSQWCPLTDMWHSQRTLRLADGPDEVHHMVVGRAEVRNREAERTSGDATSHTLGGPV